MSVDVNRLLMELDRVLKDTNKAVINPEIDVLQITDLEPVLAMVARARAAYLKRLFELAGETPEGLPALDKIETLRASRVTYEELLSASQALETAIERGYLDVGSTRSDD